MSEKDVANALKQLMENSSCNLNSAWYHPCVEGKCIKLTQGDTMEIHINNKIFTGTINITEDGKAGIVISDLKEIT